MLDGLVCGTQPSSIYFLQTALIDTAIMLSEKELNFILGAVSGVARQVPTAWLRVSGPDAAMFLQGQCTQDLRGLGAGRATWALWLSIQGKVLGESLILREQVAGEAGGVWWIWSAHTTGEVLRSRLEEFIIADDVTVEDVGVAWEQVTLVGDAAAAWVGEVPADGVWAAYRGGYLFAGRRGQPKTWEWLRPAGGGAEWPASLADLRPEELVRARIVAGVPAIPGEFGPEDLPQEAGLEVVAVSFTKGCYLGQEVMARLHAMGRVRRRLVRVAGEGAAPAAGASLHHGADEKRAGVLRAAVDDGRGGWIGLAMVNLLGLDPTKALKLGPEATVGAGWSVVLLDPALG